MFFQPLQEHFRGLLMARGAPVIVVGPASVQNAAAPAQDVLALVDDRDIQGRRHGGDSRKREAAPRPIVILAQDVQHETKSISLGSCLPLLEGEGRVLQGFPSGQRQVLSPKVDVAVGPVLPIGKPLRVPGFVAQGSLMPKSKTHPPGPHLGFEHS